MINCSVDKGKVINTHSMSICNPHRMPLDPSGWKSSRRWASWEWCQRCLPSSGWGHTVGATDQCWGVPGWNWPHYPWWKLGYSILAWSIVSETCMLAKVFYFTMALFGGFSQSMSLCNLGSKQPPTVPSQPGPHDEVPIPDTQVDSPNVKLLSYQDWWQTLKMDYLQRFSSI